MGTIAAWWRDLGHRPLPHERNAQAAWDRGDAVYVHREHQPWTTSSWASSQRVMNEHVNDIARIGWRLQAGSREVGHGYVLFTFVRDESV